MDADEQPTECRACGSPIDQPRRGRRRKWCSDNCRRRGHDQGIHVHEVVRERTVYRPERVSLDRQIARLLDDPEATERLLRTLAHRWRHDAPAGEQRQILAPTLLELWQAFHATDKNTAQSPPAKIPTRAGEQRAAVARVLSSPRSTATVLNKVSERLVRGQLRGGPDEAILNALDYLAHHLGRL
ncbi:hypothetical protein [Nocardia cyriacigeorgica]|uniref:hypothetical protein n=1 Tax=Nocardia cyriacigeorgica TaxID=135487 RepID=UPI00189459F9|nr:hypothetical protein [Nocardia cyriacigeorgica]MBF6163015.1 hypothetical protein [Nocardia cyriacigeorgica]MBF6201950.1 hypothetical protein [Nocardia cyriacigeorgica]